MMGTSRTWAKLISMTETAEDYIRDPEKYVKLFHVNINGKLRHLVTYTPTAEGRSLRRLHTTYAKYLNGRYRHAASSYA